jgi:hypothetical protein
MKIHKSDKAIAWLTLLSGLTISAVAIYYSVAGLTAIFAAAVIPIIVMGVALEISKLAATVWLKQNWSRAPIFIRTYLLSAIAILMLITSMGIFGFLSKAHSDQSLVSGDVMSKIAIYDEKIKTAKDNIDANRKAIKQMDDAVDQTMVRSTSEGGADKAVQIRRSQQKERARLAQDIEAEQKKINQLMDERAPIAAQVRAVEAEVGPIKYIASFIYGDNPDANVLEKAVTWVIIIIVVVFDPLAVILLLASQYSFMWFRKQQDEEQAETISEKNIEEPLIIQPVEETKETGYDATGYGEDVFTEDDYDEMNALDEDHGHCPKCNTKLNYAPGIGPYCPNPNCDVVDGVNLAVEEPEVEESKKSDPAEDPTWAFFPEDEKQESSDNNSINLKEAKRRWKEDHPNETIHQYALKKKLGLIDKLPWEEAEMLERPGDYVQNEEQGSDSLWQRIKKSKGDQ